MRPRCRTNEYVNCNLCQFSPSVANSVTSYFYHFTSLIFILSLLQVEVVSSRNIKWLKNLQLTLKWRVFSYDREDLPFNKSISIWMMPSLANTVAHSSSNDTVPIKITTSRTRSSSATPVTRRYDWISHEKVDSKKEITTACKQDVFHEIKLIKVKLVCHLGSQGFQKQREGLKRAAEILWAKRSDIISVLIITITVS